MTESADMPKNDYENDEDDDMPLESSENGQTALSGEFLRSKRPLPYDLDKRNIERLRRIHSILQTVKAYKIPNRRSLVAHLMSYWTLSRQTILADLNSLEDGGYLKRNGRMELITPEGELHLREISEQLEKVNE